MLEPHRLGRGRVQSQAHRQSRRAGKTLAEIHRRGEALVEKRDDRRDGFVEVIREAMATKLADNTDDVLKALTARGITRTLAKEATEIARVQGGFTIFAVIDALTRLAGRLQNAGDRSEADGRASTLLALAAAEACPQIPEAPHNRCLTTAVGSLPWALCLVRGTGRRFATPGRSKIAKGSVRARLTAPNRLRQ